MSNNQPTPDKAGRAFWQFLLSPNESRMATLVMVMLVIAVLQFPLWWVQTLVGERSSRHAKVETEIGAAWGGRQTLLGPILVLPDETYEGSGWKLGEKTRFLLPDQLSIDGNMTAEKRYRGIYETMVHSNSLRIHGEFRLPEEFRLHPPENAYLIFGMGDARGLRINEGFQWNGKQSMPRAAPSDILGYHSLHFIRSETLPLADGADGKPMEFSISLSLPGHGPLTFLPLGNRTDVTVTGNWPAPSFTGAYLPTQRTVDGESFSAHWSVSSYGRKYDSLWRRTQDGMPDFRALQQTAFAVAPIQEVNAYRQVDRAIKYGNLILLVTFLFFFLLDILGRTRIHPIQYGILGLSLSLFHVLLLSISEIVGFGPAYAISCAAILVQSGLYGRTLAGGNLLALMAAMLLGSLYGVLYLILGMESYALLGGSLVLFLGLSALMYLTRRVDWWRAQKA